MRRIYEDATVANRKDPSQLLSLDTAIKILEVSRDPEELAYYWKAARDATGKKLRKHFIEVIELTNEKAR